MDGVQVGINTGVTLTPAALGNTVNNWVGRSQFNADAFLKANMTEFRMYDVALTQQQIQDDLTFGPDVATQQGPVTFSRQPQSTTVTELQPVTFTASVNGSPPYSFNGIGILFPFWMPPIIPTLFLQRGSATTELFQRDGQQQLHEYVVYDLEHERNFNRES